MTFDLDTRAFRDATAPELFRDLWLFEYDVLAALGGRPGLFSPGGIAIGAIHGDGPVTIINDIDVTVTINVGCCAAVEPPCVAPVGPVVLDPAPVDRDTVAWSRGGTNFDTQFTDADGNPLVVVRNDSPEPAPFSGEDINGADSGEVVTFTAPPGLSLVPLEDVDDGDVFRWFNDDGQRLGGTSTLDLTVTAVHEAYEPICLEGLA